MEDKKASEGDTQLQLLKVLDALKQASHELRTHPFSDSSVPIPSSLSCAIKAILNLETSVISSDLRLQKLSQLITTLRSLIKTLEESRSYPGIRSFLNRIVYAHKISRVTRLIDSEIQAWIDREIVLNLNNALQDFLDSSSASSSLSSVLSQSYQEEDKLIDLADRLCKRLAVGFDRVLQDSILKSRVFQKLELVLWSTCFSERVREGAAYAIAETIKFNKDVFVGLILIGQSQTVRSLVSMGTASSLQVLCELIKSIKSPLVDDIEANGEMEKIVRFLSSDDLSICIAAINCVFEIGYFGMRGAIEALLNAGLIKILFVLERRGPSEDLIGAEESKSGCEKNLKGRGKNDEEGKPFERCVLKFTVQLEVGEGLRQMEKRAFKKGILKSVRDASASDAEAAMIVSEVLWFSSP